MGGESGSLTIQYYVGGKISGLESERPLTNNLPANTTFIETDTFKEFIWDGIDTWNQIGAGAVPNMDDSNLLAYYTFQETSGNLLNQSLSTASVGVAGEGVNSGGVTQGVSGLIGNAYDYNGVNGTKTTLGTAPATFNLFLSSVAQFSIIQWIFPTSLANGVILLDQTNASSGNFGILVKVDNANVFNTSIFQGTPDIINSGVADSLIVGVWNMISITYDFSLGSANIKVKLNDGVANTANTLNAGQNGTPTGNLTIAEAISGNDLPYNGLMAETSVWSRVLTDAEITTLYNSGNGFSIYG